MKKICFVLIVDVGINYGLIFFLLFLRNQDDLKEYFFKYYDVLINYIRDKSLVDYLVVFKLCLFFDNENNFLIIEVLVILFMEKDFEKIKIYIDNYFFNNL